MARRYPSMGNTDMTDRVAELAPALRTGQIVTHFRPEVSLAAGAGLLVTAQRPLAAADSSGEPVPDGDGGNGDGGNGDGNADGTAASVGLAILAHELAGPVTILAGYAELLVTTTDPEVRAQSIEPIRRATRRARAALALVNDVAAMEAGRLTVARETITLGTVVTESMESMQLAGSLDDARCHVDVDDVVFEGDIDRLGVVVSNLIGNAVKHTPPGSSISVRGAIEGDSAVLRVTDDGPGITPDEVGVIFRRFGRLPGTTEGTGLGLYLARGIVRAHGGDLTCRPAPGGGAEFVMELPLSAVPSTARTTRPRWGAPQAA